MPHATNNFRVMQETEELIVKADKADDFLPDQFAELSDTIGEWNGRALKHFWIDVTALQALKNC